MNRSLRLAVAPAVFAAMVASTQEAAAERAAVVLGGELTRQEEAPLWTAAANAVRDAGWSVVGTNLSPPAASELLACVGRDISDNEGCVAALFERTRVDRAVVLRVRSTSDQGQPAREMSGWVFRPSGKSLKYLQRFCHKCPTRGLEASARDLVASLVRSARVRARPSRLLVQSIPSGAQIRIDDKAVGETDMDFEVYPGRHVVELAKDGFLVATRDITVDDGENVTVDVTLKPKDGSARSRRPAHSSGQRPGHASPARAPRPKALVPWLVIGAGGSALAAGGLLLALDQDSSSQGGVRDNEFRQTSWYAVGAVAAGGVAIGVGLYLLLRRADDTAPAPMVSLDDGAAWLGVRGAF